MIILEQEKSHVGEMIILQPNSIVQKPNNLASSVNIYFLKIEDEIIIFTCVIFSMHGWNDILREYDFNLLDVKNPQDQTTQKWFPGQFNTLSLICVTKYIDKIIDFTKMFKLKLIWRKKK